jgi:hypothetical protein
MTIKQIGQLLTSVGVDFAGTPMGRCMARQIELFMRLPGRPDTICVAFPVSVPPDAFHQLTSRGSPG